MTDKHPRGLKLDGMYYISLVNLENARFFSPNERKITRYMNLLEKLRESRVTIDFPEMFDWLPLVLSWHSHFCLVYRAIFSFYCCGMLLSHSSVGHLFQFEIKY